MEGKLDLPENKLRDFIQKTDKGKWICNNNHNIKYFTEDEIKSITGNYNTKLGNGAFGEVYRGDLGNGRSVAVKRYIHVNSEEEFAKEVIVHSQINHKNVVRLIGCCTEENAQMMVFEHVTNGNLSDRLHCGDTQIFLNTRLTIAIECAEALGCMHSMYNPVLHGDIKPSNILLDDNFHAKVSDFGISRLLSRDNECTLNVRGSIGYMDPAFYNEGRLTPKSDVYSFGVVLVELITKTKPTDSEKKIIERFARFSGKALRDLFDADIANPGNMRVLEGIAKIAKDCLRENTDERPEMYDIAGQLRGLRKILENGKEKAGWRFFSEDQSASEKRDQHENNNNNVGSSSVAHRINSLSIFNKSAPYFKNSIKTLQNMSNIVVFTKKEIMNITQNFSKLVGKGRYSEVYLGTLDDNTRVAVKRSLKISEYFRELAVNELIIHTQMRHTNILKILGCCPEMDVPVLVHEYAPNGSLDKYLFANMEKEEESSPDQHHRRQLMNLNTRYRIVLGVARAMVYLHEERLDWVLHCDIKPENILLDDHFCPKVSDFGLSKMANQEKMKFQSVHGSCGYMAPEWFIHRAPITAKADVYSFGMMLLEIISRRRNYEFLQETVGSNEWYFPKWAYEKVYVEQRMEDILDLRIIQTDAYGDAKSVAMVERMVMTAIWCLQDSAEMRPSMGKVIKMLEGTVDITEPAKPIIFCIEEI